MAFGDHQLSVNGTALVLACATLPLAAGAQTLFLCEDRGRAFVVAGPEGAPGCRALTEPQRELGLAPAEPDLDALTREIARLAARVDRLEALMTGTRIAPRVPSPALRQQDPFDSRGRMRDLGQNLDRRLEGR